MDHPTWGNSLLIWWFLHCFCEGCYQLSIWVQPEVELYGGPHVLPGLVVLPVKKYLQNEA